MASPSTHRGEAVIVPLFASLFWPYAWAPYYADGGFGYYGYDPGLPFAYGDAGYARTRVARAGAVSRNRAPTDMAAAAPTAVSGMCSGQAGDLTGLPIDQIDRTIQPTGDQPAGLFALRYLDDGSLELIARTFAGLCQSRRTGRPLGWALRSRSMPVQVF
jgi:hypothetical protein